MKKTKVICTIGPACESEDILERLVDSGMNVARLNFSHGDYEGHKKRIDSIRKIGAKKGIPLAILLDTKGPEIRTGEFCGNEIKLTVGQEYTLTSRDVLGDEVMCSVSYKGLPDDVDVGDVVLIDDGLIELKVAEVANKSDIRCVVCNSGTIKSNKGINVPGVHINLPSITEEDREDIEFGIKNGIDFIAASFVRNTTDLIAIKEVLKDNNAMHIKIISKIENEEGVRNIDEIIQLSDGIMIARGDLGVEIPAEELPLLQKRIIQKCNDVGKPVVTATQMLDSMIRNPRPTRAEVSDIANAILDGTDAIMLSGETAIGKYPVESVATMSQIAMRTEELMDYPKLLYDKSKEKDSSLTDAISHATCNIALSLNASAIITGTTSGYTARMVSKFRPKQSIIATTTDEATMRQLCLSWGIYPILLDYVDSTDELIDKSVGKALDCKRVQKDDLVVITAGIPVGVDGTTNMLKAHVV